MITLTQSFPAPAHPGSVVLVDDEPMVLRSLAHMLNRIPYVVAPCKTCHEAIHQITQGHVRVVVSDVTMPEMSDIELLRTIREHDPDLPVILITGRPELETATEAVEYGAFRYLIKPVEGARLVEAVQQAASIHQLAQTKRASIALFGADADEERAASGANFEHALSQVWVAYQPIVRASDRTVFGYEALLRSHDPCVESPGHLLQEAEHHGALHRLGRAVRKRAAFSMSNAPHSYALFVNVHPQELLDPELYDVQASLMPFAGRVIFEITERSAITDVDGAKKHVARLRNRGFRIAIDDLGVGYAGLSSFAVLEPEFVKLDMTPLGLVSARHQFGAHWPKTTWTSCSTSLGRNGFASTVTSGKSRNRACTLSGA
jgi:EAL domain-containing protein (putative c-di-GMP-specific phosphodiesterase class I)